MVVSKPQFDIPGRAWVKLSLNGRRDSKLHPSQQNSDVLFLKILHLRLACVASKVNRHCDLEAGTSKHSDLQLNFTMLGLHLRNLRPQY